MQDKFIRRAKLVRVIDGDTVELDIDLGFHLTRRDHVRVLGVNCPELHGTTREAGERAKLFTIGWFEGHGQDIMVRTYKDKSDSFGRYLAEIVGVGSTGIDSLGADLLLSQNAVPYMSGVLK